VIIEELRVYLIKNQPAIPPKSLLGQAVRYTLHQWSKLLTFLHDGRLDISNNLSERAIKPFVIGPKGWLFDDSVEGAHAAVAIFSSSKLANTITSCLTIICDMRSM
jgi:transposase